LRTSSEQFLKPILENTGLGNHSTMSSHAAFFILSTNADVGAFSTPSSHTISHTSSSMFFYFYLHDLGQCLKRKTR